MIDKLLMQNEFETEMAAYDYQSNMPNMHYHYHYEILYISKNKRILKVGEKEFLLDCNSVALIPPRIPHMTMSGETLPEEKILVYFHESFIHNIRSVLPQNIMSCFTSPCNVILIKDFEEDFLSVIKNLHFSSTETEKILLLSRLLQLLSDNSPNCQKNEGADEIIAFVEANFSEKISLDMLSERFHLSKFTISRYFSKHAGTSLPKFLNSIRVINAKRYLRANMKIIDVAHQCGFESVSNFDRVFTSIEGISPAKYRKNERN